MASKSAIRTGGFRASIRELGGPELVVKTGRRQGTMLTAPNFPEKPADFEGTLPEWAVYWAHLRLQRKPGVDFEFKFALDESPNGIDFYEYDAQMGIEIQGLFWHYGFGGFKIADDVYRRVRLEAAGITVVNIDEDHALADPVHYLREALLGRDHSRLALGIA